MSSIPLPSIWTPGRESSASWWSRRLRDIRDSMSVFTAGREQRDPSTGKAKRNAANGKTKNNTDTNTACCCGCPGVPCTNGCADGTTPKYWRIAWSGVNVCLDQCIFYGHPSPGTSNNAKITGPTSVLSGSYTMTQQYGTTDPCQWGSDWDTVTGNTLTVYVDDTCTTVFGTDDLGLSFVLERISGGWTFVIYSRHASLLPQIYFTSTISDPDPANCTPESLTFNNDLTTCGGSSGGAGENFGYGGTVVIVPCLA